MTDTQYDAEFTISLPIADRRRAADFYRAAFGFEPAGAAAEDGLPEPLQYRLGAGVMLALIPADGLAWVLGDRRLASPQVTESLLGITFDTVSEVDAAVNRTRGAGGSVIVEPAAQDWGYTAICADPDGHAWQITARPGEAG